MFWYVVCIVISVFSQGDGQKRGRRKKKTTRWEESWERKKREGRKGKERGAGTMLFIEKWSVWLFIKT